MATSPVPAPTSAYRHVGQYTEHKGMPRLCCKKFGQLVALPEALATELILDAKPFMTDEQFQTYGFTEDELKKWWNVHNHGHAPADFQAKRNKIWADLPALRQALADKQPPPEIK
jgi:hypothetical protein